MKTGFRIEVVTDYPTLDNGDLDIDNAETFDKFVYCDRDGAIQVAKELAKRSYHEEVIVTPFIKGNFEWGDYEYEEDEMFHVDIHGEV